EKFESKLIELVNCFRKFTHYNKMMVCGNGGSASDSLHFVGEMMKNFTIKRSIDENISKNYQKFHGEDDVLKHTHGAIRTMSLTSEISLITAIANDIGYDYIFSQQVYGYGDEGDILFAFSTSGNSKSVINACKMAQAKKILVVGFTGKTGGKIKDYCDILINVDSTDTIVIQQNHEILFHIIAQVLEIERFSNC
ncbi:MAG: SIS domain-containing protein, partial [Acholeplasmataceae bacterium]|nr:SIS domain-containing protein [Acholeplasmataceae bacterium]